jgi:hypothetical protein
LIESALPSGKDLEELADELDRLISRRHGYNVVADTAVGPDDAEVGIDLDELEATRYSIGDVVRTVKSYPDVHDVWYDGEGNIIFR